MRGTRERRGRQATAFVGACLLVGLVWFALDLVYIAATDIHVDASALARRAGRFLPWHLGAFALLGTGMGLLAWLLHLSGTRAGWWALWMATAFFGGSRIFEGALHWGPPLPAARDAALVIAGFGVCLALLAFSVARLPNRMRKGLAPAVWAAWSLISIAWLRRAGPALGLGEIELLDSLGMLRPADLAAALAAGVAIVFLARTGGGPRASATAALALTVLLPVIARSGEARDPDVIVVLLDTLRADHLGAGPGPDRTPELERYAGQFFRFERAFSPSTRTALAMPGIMTALTPAVVTNDVMPPQAITLPERLQEAGWSTFGISANPRVSAQFGYDQGFDELAGPEAIPDLLIVPPLKLLAAALPGPAFHLGLADAELYYPRIPELTRRGLRILDAHPESTLLWLQTMDVHGPFLPPKRYLSADYRPEHFLSYYELLRVSGTERMGEPEMGPQLENLRQRYSAEVRFTDVELAAFFDALKARRRWDESFVVILSDHGEAFGEHGFGGHGHEYVGSALVHVPFWVKPPKSLGFSPRAIRHPVSTYDLFPTLLALLGLPPLTESFGTDLAPLMRGDTAGEARIVIAQSSNLEADHYAVVRGSHKLDVRIAIPSGERSWLLYDLDADPLESEDRAGGEPEVVSALLAATDRHRARESELSFERREQTVDPAVRQRLRALGYVDD